MLNKLHTWIRSGIGVSRCDLCYRELSNTNSYFFFSLVPFDEDDKDDSVWFLDHDYLENMYGMFKKVNGMS